MGRKLGEPGRHQVQNLDGVSLSPNLSHTLSLLPLSSLLSFSPLSPLPLSLLYLCLCVSVYFSPLLSLFASLCFFYLSSLCLLSLLSVSLCVSLLSPLFAAVYFWSRSVFALSLCMCFFSLFVSLSLFVFFFSLSSLCLCLFLCLSPSLPYLCVCFSPISSL